MLRCYETVPAGPDRVKEGLKSGCERVLRIERGQWQWSGDLEVYKSETGSGSDSHEQAS